MRRTFAEVGESDGPVEQVDLVEASQQGLADVDSVEKALLNFTITVVSVRSALDRRNHNMCKYSLFDGLCQEGTTAALFYCYTLCTPTSINNSRFVA